MAFSAKYSKVAASLAAAALLVSAAAPAGVSVVPGFDAATPAAWAEDTATYTVVLDPDIGNGTSTLTNGSTFAVGTKAPLLCVAGEGYYIDKIEYKNGSNWVAFPEENVKSTPYPSRVNFNIKSDYATTWTLRVTYSQLPAGQSNTDVSTAADTDTLKIRYHSALNNAEGEVTYSTTFRDGVAQTNPNLKSLAALKQALIDGNYSGDAFNPGANTTFEGWATTSGGPVVYANEAAITHAMWESATTTLQDGAKQIELYAVWSGDLGALSGTCSIDGNVWNGFSFDTHSYEFTETSSSASHSVRFVLTSNTWTGISTHGNGTIVKNGQTYNTMWIKHVFSRAGEPDQEYLFTWVIDPAANEQSLQEALNGITVTVTDPADNPATISPAFSYATTSYTATGADLSNGMKMGFSPGLSSKGITITNGTATSQTNTATDGSSTTVVSYPFTLTKGNESKTFTINYTYTTAAPEPSYNEITADSLQFNVDGSPFTQFNPTTTSYRLQDNVNHNITVAKCPAGWTATETAVSGTTDTGSTARHTWKLTKGNLSRSYDFTWNMTNTPTVTEPSYDELSSLTFKVDGSTYTQFNPSATNYPLANNSDHNVSVGTCPDGWTVKETAKSSLGPDGRIEAERAFELTKGNLSRTYRFSWVIEGTSGGDSGSGTSGSGTSGSGDSGSGTSGSGDSGSGTSGSGTSGSGTSGSGTSGSGTSGSGTSGSGTSGSGNSGSGTNNSGSNGDQASSGNNASSGAASDQGSNGSGAQNGDGSATSSGESPTIQIQDATAASNVNATNVTASYSETVSQNASAQTAQGTQQISPTGDTRPFAIITAGIAALIASIGTTLRRRRSK